MKLSNQQSATSFVEIAVGVLRREHEVCLSFRQKHQFQAEKWEFPGGKVKQDETIENALVREFEEELGVHTDNWHPLISIPWHYNDVSVRLNVFQSWDFSGEPSGMEGQLVKWFAIDQLDELHFPAANQGILTALKLGDRYAISGSFADQAEFAQKLHNVMLQDITLVQLRAKGLSEQQIIDLVAASQFELKANNARMLVNSDNPEILDKCAADGLQLSSSVLFAFEERPIPKNKLLGASTHNAQEIQQALKIGADFILLSPVLPTQTHPDMPALGWEVFAQWVQEIPIPVFALGGMQHKNLIIAKEQYGAQGIAAISEFWLS